MSRADSSARSGARFGDAGRRAAGALAGLVAGVSALAAAELSAAVLRRPASPVLVVGAAFVDRVPRQLKEFAIQAFGQRDKLVLLIGVFGAVMLLAAALGALSVSRRVVGYWGVALLTLVAAASALTRPGAGVADAVPSLVGGLVGCLALRLLLDAAGGAPPRAADVVSAGSLGTDRKIILGRRRFLGTALATGAVSAAGGGLGFAVLRQRLDAAASRAAVELPRPDSPAGGEVPSDDLGVDGVTPFYTPVADFYRVDTALLVPQIAADKWSLSVGGMVAHPVQIAFAQLLSRPMIERDITLTCVSNEVGGPLAGTARWLGVPLRAILDEAGVARGADQIVSRSADGMTIGTPTALATDGRDAMIAVGMNGRPLPAEHGFPARMIVPGLYGYVSATKWLVSLELARFSDFDAYWVRRGWAQQAPIKTSSRIDTPRDSALRKPGTVPVAGVAWAQHRGISRVEVRVDSGPWQKARLGPAPTSDVWRQWAWNWTDAAPGRHRLEVRATDGTGQVQPEARTAPFPSGASGWHSIQVRIE